MWLRVCWNVLPGCRLMWLMLCRNVLPGCQLMWLMLCQNVLPGGRLMWLVVCRDVLPGCRVNVSGSAVTCCRGAGLMPEGLPGRCQERLGTRENPQFGAA